MSTLDGSSRPGGTPPGRFTWRMLATVLGSQSLVVFFGALVGRGMAGKDSSAWSFILLCVLAGVCVLAAGLVRRPGGVLLGTVVQVLTVLSGFLVPMMFLVGLVFLGLWVLCLHQGRRIDAAEATRLAA